MGPKSGWGGVVRLSQTSPIPRSPDGDNNFINKFQVEWLVDHGGLKGCCLKQRANYWSLFVLPYQETADAGSLVSHLFPKDVPIMALFPYLRPYTEETS